MVSIGSGRLWVRVADIHVSVVTAVALNANRLVTGVLRGFDQFMNIVLDNTVDEKSHTDIGMVVSWSTVFSLADKSASHPAINVFIAVGDPREQHSDGGSYGAIIVVVTVPWSLQAQVFSFWHHLRLHWLWLLFILPIHRNSLGSAAQVKDLLQTSAVFTMPQTLRRVHSNTKRNVIHWHS